ncbi:MAG: ATP-binding protein [Pseudomonadota bacterium]
MLDGVLCPLNGATAYTGAQDLDEPSTVLLVDSDADQASETQSHVVRSSGGRTFVLHVDSLAAALVSLGSGDFDAVLINPNLSDSRGIDTVILLMQQALDVPVVVLCDADQEPLAIEALQYGVQDVLVHENLARENIQRVIRYACERHRLHSDIESRIRKTESFRRRCRSVVDDNADAMVVVDQEGVVRYANPAACSLMAMDAETLVGSPFGLPIEGMSVSEVDILRSDHVPVVADIRAMETRWDGEPAFIATMRDITARREKENSLKLAEHFASEATRLKSEFLANISHELRTPLNAVIGFSDLLRLGVHGPLGDPRYDEYLDHIKESGTSLLALLDDLLLLAKAEADRLDLSERRVDLGSVIASVMTEFNADAREAELHLVSEIEPGSCFAWVDPHYVHRVIHGLVSNAIKFSDSAGEVVISHQPVLGGGLMITIKDEGPGIDAEDVATIFGAFGRLESSYSASKVQGVGLGLAIAKKLIEQHDGTIRVTSEPGCGTAVHLTLPSNRVLSAEAGTPLRVVSSNP